MSAQPLSEEKFCDFLNIVEWQIFMDENLPEQQQATDFLLALSGQISPRAKYSRKTWKRFRDMFRDDTRGLLEPVHPGFHHALNDLCDSVLENPESLPDGFFTLRRTAKGEKAMLLALVNALENNKAEDFVKRHLGNFGCDCPEGRKSKARELRGSAKFITIEEEEIDPVEARRRRNTNCEI